MNWFVSDMGREHIVGVNRQFMSKICISHGSKSINLRLEGEIKMEETRYFELEEPGGHGRVASMAKQADERMVKRLFEAIGIEEIDIDGKTDDEVYDLLETARGYDTPGAHIKLIYLKQIY